MATQHHHGGLEKIKTYQNFDQLTRQIRTIVQSDPITDRHREGPGHSPQLYKFTAHHLHSSLGQPREKADRSPFFQQHQPLR